MEGREGGREEGRKRERGEQARERGSEGGREGGRERGGEAGGGGGRREKNIKRLGRHSFGSKKLLIVVPKLNTDNYVFLEHYVTIF